MTIFNIAHISDLHLSVIKNHQCLPDLWSNHSTLESLHVIQSRLRDKSAFKDAKFKVFYPSTFDADRLDILATFLKNQDGVDVIVVSGDLSTTGSEKDVEVAFNFLHNNDIEDEYFFDKFPSLQHMNTPYIIIPGNHDRYSKGVGGFNATHFDDVFDRTQHSCEYNYWDKGKNVVSRVIKKESEQLMFIGVDFSLKSKSDATRDKMLIKEFNSWGQGKVDDKSPRFKELKRLTIDAKENNIPVVWVVHFPPFYEEKYLKDNDSLKLIGSDILINLASYLGVSYILCGHQHQHAYYEVNNVKIIVAGSAASAESKNTELNNIKFTVEQGKIKEVIVKNYIYNINPEVNNFEEHNSTPKPFIT